MLLLPILVALFIGPGSGPAPKPDLLRINLDTTKQPGKDFYEYACGGWMKQNPIPAAESTWGIGNLVRDELYTKLRAINEKAAKAKAVIGTDTQKVGDFWATAMDLNMAETVGVTPLKNHLTKIDSVNDLQGAIDLSFELHEIGGDPFFGFGIGQDDKQSDVMAVGITQGGLGLPDRDFYFNTEEGVSKIRAEYGKYVQQVLEYAGQSDSATAAPDVIAFETALAKVSRKIEDLRDPERNYNKLPVSQVETKLTPNISWKKHLENWHLTPKTLLVGQPEFFSGLNGLLLDTKIETLKSYLRFHLVKDFLPYLDKKADAIDFHFNHVVMSGQKEPQPRWKRVLGSENQSIGFILGRLFVKDYFPPTAKKRYSDLVEAIRKSLSRRINKLDWMSPATKAKAQDKLAAVKKKVGYPEKWKDYSKLSVGRSSYCDNIIRANQWAFKDMLSKFGKPVDHTEWGMPPQIFNAYYSASENEIVLPAAGFAIPGMKDSDIDDALLYGNAGAGWIGHELTHGFDDQGRQYDKKGNLKSWWTKADEASFKKRAELMVQQFNQYEPIKGIHINGKAALGENIADYGGLLIGLDAFKLTKAYKSGKKIAGLTPLQRYFLGYTIGWLENQRPELLRRELLSDVHAPAKWRVIGPLSNIPEFYQAFGIKKGDPMWRPANQRVHVW